VGRLRDLGDAEKEALDAAASGGFRDEVVHALRSGVRPKSIWQATGRRLGFPAALFLLADLCEREGELGRVFYGAASGSSEIGQADMRAVRQDDASARSSPGWELPEQLARELGDVVPRLPQTGASLAGFTGHPLAHGVSARVGRLRGYGNAIVPPLAAEFIKAYLEC
jgi:hypothetical protein